MTGYAHPPLVIGGLYYIPDTFGLGDRSKETGLLLQVCEEGVYNGDRRMAAKFLLNSGHLFEVKFLFGGLWHVGMTLRWKP